MFWAVLGIGMLINTLSGGMGGPSRAQAQRQFEASMRSLRATLEESNQAVLQRYEAKVPTYQWEFEPPPYPQKNYANLQRLQQHHLEMRQGFRQQLRHQVDQAKTRFFAENHYETRPQGPDQEPRVLVGKDGRPVVKKGPETPQQQVARQEFERARRRETEERQVQQKDRFLQQQQQNVRQFLTAHQAILGDPNVQAQLQRMLTETHRKALDLERRHEEERWKVDLPPSEEIVAVVDQGLAELRQLEEDQALIEEQSPDMRALMEHEQKIAQLLSEQKQVARQRRQEEAFLQDPRQALAAAREAPDFAEVLPAYLTNALYNMGIYSV